MTTPSDTADPATGETDDPEGDPSPTFWDWSMDIYGKPGVAERLLRLQDNFGLDVNISLWCIWAAEELEALGTRQVQGLIRLCEGWAERVTIPIRGARKWMKGQDLPADTSAISALRNEVKDLELRAERISQDMLEAESRDCAGTGTPATGNQAEAYFSLYLDLADSGNKDHAETSDELSENAEKQAALDLFREIMPLTRSEEVPEHS